MASEIRLLAPHVHAVSPHASPPAGGRPRELHLGVSRQTAHSDMRVPPVWCASTARLCLQLRDAGAGQTCRSPLCADPPQHRDVQVKHALSPGSGCQRPVVRRSARAQGTQRT
ncbi:hypothetical protein VTJ49DRAFT_5261 [Mycothermus thermophilus]|uniref:Uncharacterized protein n=1 Tax=Humicola insolens TaxID=85995 RepID=A0ABR3V4I0_HUMIN